MSLSVAGPTEIDDQRAFTKRGTAQERSIYESISKYSSHRIRRSGSARNAALRSAGFDVTAAICLEDVFRLCRSSHFDVTVVGHVFPVAERGQFVRWPGGDSRLPLILIDEGEILASLPADSHIH